jgi:hypothetical protein
MNKNSFITSLKINIDKLRKKNILKLLENKEFNKIDNFDGYAVKFYKESIKEKIEKLKDNNNNNKGKNILIDTPFPLISVLSQRKILNKSKVLIPKIVISYRNKLSKIDEQLIKNKTIDDEIKNGIYKKIIRKKNFRKRNINSYDNNNNTDFIPFWNKTTYKLHGYRIIHDSNFYNKIFFKNDPMINYDRNSYKIKQLYNNDIFINKIKEDVSSLKFSNNLRANNDYHFI